MREWRFHPSVDRRCFNPVRSNRSSLRRSLAWVVLISWFFKTCELDGVDGQSKTACSGRSFRYAFAQHDSRRHHVGCSKMFASQFEFRHSDLVYFRHLLCWPCLLLC
jgi:hypothetical protein